jgi:hypothetical protein
VPEGGKNMSPSIKTALRTAGCADAATQLAAVKFAKALLGDVAFWPTDLSGNRQQLTYGSMMQMLTDDEAELSRKAQGDTK